MVTYGGELCDMFEFKSYRDPSTIQTISLSYRLDRNPMIEETNTRLLGTIE